MKLALKKFLLATLLCSTTTLSYGMEAAGEMQQESIGTRPQQMSMVAGAKISQCQRTSFREYKEELFKQKKKELIDYFDYLIFSGYLGLMPISIALYDSHSIASILQVPILDVIEDHFLKELLQISDTVDYVFDSVGSSNPVKYLREKNKDILKYLSLINYSELGMDVFNLAISPLSETELRRFARLEKNSKNETLKKIMKNLHILHLPSFSGSIEEDSKKYFPKHDDDNDEVGECFLVAPRITFIMLMIDDNVLDQKKGYGNWKYLDANFSSFFPFTYEHIEAELTKNYMLVFEEDNLVWDVIKNELTKKEKSKLKEKRKKEKIKSPLFFDFIGSKIPKDEQEYQEISKIAETPKDVLKAQFEELGQESGPSEPFIEQMMSDLRLKPTVLPELRLEHTIKKQQPEEKKSSLKDGAAAAQQKQLFYKKEDGKIFYTEKDYNAYQQTKVRNLEQQQKILKALTMQKVYKHQLINQTSLLSPEERDLAFKKLDVPLATQQSIQDLFTGTYDETKMDPKELYVLYADLKISKENGRTSGTHGHMQTTSGIGMQVVSHGSYGDKYYGKKTMGDIKQKINFILHQALYQQ